VRRRAMRRNYVPTQIRPGGYGNLMYLLGVFHSRASGSVAIRKILRQTDRSAKGEMRICQI
jgi:hypothetical protein